MNIVFHIEDSWFIHTDTHYSIDLLINNLQIEITYLFFQLQSEFEY